MRKRKIICIFLAGLLLFGLCPAAAAADTELSYSDALVKYIEDGEGFRATAYNDGTGWYIGYGTSCDPSHYPDGITQEAAEQLLRLYMDSFAATARSFLKKYGITVNQGQFDAMCAMSYALGPSWMSAGNRLPSYMIAGIDNYTDQEIAAAFAAWCHVGGAVNTNALRRRIAEANMFLYGKYDAEGWCWLKLDANGGSNETSDVTVYKTGEAYGTLPKPTCSGKYFVGWCTSDGALLLETDIVRKNLSVTALWSSTPVEHTAAESTPTATPAPSASPTPTVTTPTVFPDVDAGSWYAGYVTSLHSSGVINGYEDGTFRPTGKVTWGEALKLILLASGYSTQPAESGGHWASGYLRFAERKQFISSGSVTNLDQAITRNEMADLCAAALNLTGTVASPYADSSRTSVLKLYAAGIMEGSIENGQRYFKGKNDITRAEICAVLVRVTDYVDQNVILFSGSRIPIDRSLRLNSYDKNSFTTDANGRIRYNDGKTTVRYGIDVSEYQGDINWNAVAADGIDFVMIRCGYRTYGSGLLNEDPNFRRNIAGALAAGLDVGIYFFSQAVTVAEAVEEANYCLELISGYDISFPVTFDWEIVTSSGSRTRYYSGPPITDLMKAFCDIVAAHGYTPLTYYNPSLAYFRLDIAAAQRYDGWLAHYNVSITDYAYDFQMWQYSSTGKVNGISTRVDLDIAFVDYAAK